MSSPKEIDDMTVVQLREQLKKLTLKTSGNKAELQERLRSSVSKKKSSPKVSPTERVLPPNVLQNIMEHADLNTAATFSMVDKRHRTVLQRNLKKHPEYMVELNLSNIFDYKGVYLTPNGKKIITIGYYQIYIWDTQTGELLHTITVPHDNEFACPTSATSIISPNGKILAQCVKSRAYLDTPLLELWLWSLEDYSLIRKVNIINHTYNPNILTFSPDSKKVIICDSDLGGTPKMSTFDVSTGDLVHQLPLKSSLASIVFSPSGKFLVLFGRTILVIDLKTMTVHYEIPPPPSRRRSEPPFHVRMKFIPNKDILIVGSTTHSLKGQDIIAHDLVEKTIIYTLENNTRIKNIDFTHGDLFDISSDGILATIHKDNVSIELRDAITGELKRIFKPEVLNKKQFIIGSLVFSPNDPNILVYNVQDIMYATLKGHIALHDIKKQEIVRKIFIKESRHINKLEIVGNVLMALTYGQIYVFPYLFKK